MTCSSFPAGPDASAAIAVVTTVGCPHCKRVKDALASNGFAYVPVDMSDKPGAALVELKRLTKRGTVPQVFVGGKMIGGADETVELIKSGRLREMVEEVARGTGGEGPFGYEAGVYEVLFGDGSGMRGGPDGGGPDGGGPDGGVLSGSDNFVAELRRVRALGITGTESIPDEDRDKLLAWRVIVQEDDGSLVWSATRPMVDKSMFERCGRSMPLNGHLPSRVTGTSSLPSTDQSSDPVVISSRLRTLLLALYDVYLADDGSKVDYGGLRNDPLFRAYVDLASSLEDVDLSRLDTKESKLAFWINTYNSLIVHALAIVGPAENTLQRLTWFNRVAYRIGGHVFSADDIEHGILRGNASPPASFLNLLGLKALAAKVSPTFGASDPRQAFSLDTEEVDPRIHFALNCGANSCPAIKVYSAELLEEGLQGAATAFCEEEVRFVDGEDGRGRVLELSSILKWYGGDFGATQHARLRYVLPYVGDGVRRELEGKTDDELDGMQVAYRKYDWNLNTRSSTSSRL